MRPLDAAAVERVIGSLERMVTELERSGKVGDVSVDGSEGPIPLWQIQHAIANADGTSLVESPTLKDLLLASGYDDSPFVVEEWQLQADRVLDVYGSIESGSEVGDPAHDHEEDRVTIGRYRQQLSALALRLASS